MVSIILIDLIVHLTTKALNPRALNYVGRRFDLFFPACWWARRNNYQMVEISGNCCAQPNY